MNDHAHHYVLPSTGHIVRGVCVVCGHEREFDNSIPETTMGGTATTAMTASRAAGAAKRKGRPIVLTPAEGNNKVLDYPSARRQPL